MKRNILICLNPGVSHFLPTIELAKEHLSRGNNVYYLGFSNLEKLVVSEGFNFISIKTIPNESFINKLKSQYKLRELDKLYKEIINEIKEVILKENISLVLFDINRFHLYYLPAIETNTPCISFWTFSGATNINPLVPPNSSLAIPKGNSNINISAFTRWIFRYIRREFCKPQTFFSKFIYPQTQLRKVAREQNLKWKYNINGLYLDTTKFILGPKELEFPNPYDKNIHYLGLCVNKGRKEEELHWEHYDENKVLIYCSLGTLSSRYEHAEKFFNSVIEVFKNEPEWQLVMNIGNLCDKDKFKDLSENIYLSNSVPQMDVLSKSSLMLTHGGYGSIKECVSSEVPMIVFPCIYDQPGNAARVQYHGIGVVEDISKVTPEKLTILIKEMLHNNKYKQKIKKMNELISSQNTIKSAVTFSEFISKKNT
jgi:zeaxanthin glucosyltransferase